MSLSQAAELADIPEERIRMYEEGVRRPYGKTLRRLADVYGVRVAELVAPGQALRARGVLSEPRRRRPRMLAPPADVAEITLPLEVEEGQTVRLMIELVVRRRADADWENGAARAQAGPELIAPAVVAEEEAQPAAEAGAEDTRRRRRPRALSAEGRAPGLGDEGGRQARDPILELKRAYRDFRHKKK